MGAFPSLFSHFNSLYLSARSFKDLLKVREFAPTEAPPSLKTHGKEGKKGT